MFEELTEDLDFLNAPLDLPSDEDMTSVNDLVQSIIEHKKFVEKAENAIAMANAKVQELERLLPEKLTSLGIDASRFKLETEKYSFQIKPYYSVSIIKDQKSLALDWLDQNGHSNVIKREIKIPLGKDKQQATALAEKLTSLGYQYVDVLDVHYQTLNALYKDQLNNGETSWPTQYFNTYSGYKSIMKAKQND